MIVLYGILQANACAEIWRARQKIPHPLNIISRAMEEPLACKVLRKFLPRLSKTLDPSVIATELHSADIVDSRVWEETRKDAQGANYDRCLNLLEALIRSTRATPACFEKFCAILEDQEVTKTVASQLREELKKLEGEAIKGPLVNSEYTKNFQLLIVIIACHIQRI